MLLGIGLKLHGGTCTRYTFLDQVNITKKQNSNIREKSDGGSLNTPFNLILGLRGVLVCFSSYTLSVLKFQGSSSGIVLRI